MPVYLEESILSLPLIYINGGSRGFLVSMPPSELVRVLKPVVAAVIAWIFFFFLLTGLQLTGGFCVLLAIVILQLGSVTGRSKQVCRSSESGNPGF